MTRLMFDSTNTNDDPLGAQLVAYYIDGIYAVSEAIVKARFPHSVLVPISAIGTNNGIVGDVEPGCMTILQAVAWVKQRRLAGLDPTLYVNQTYGWQPTRQAFISAGIKEPHWWVANYDGVAVVPSGAVAKQYANPTLTHGHFDLSIVADFWPGVDGIYGPTQGQLGGYTVSGQFQNGTEIEHATYISEAKELWHGWRNCDPPTSTAWAWENLGAPTGLACEFRDEYLCDAKVHIQIVRCQASDGNMWCRYSIEDSTTPAWGGWVSMSNPVLADNNQGAPGKDGTNGENGKDAVGTIPTLWDILKATFAAPSK